MDQTPAEDEGYRVALSADDLAAGSATVVQISGTPVAVFRLGDRFYATSQLCPHVGGPIASGRIEGTTVTCPYHGWEFDIRTGACPSSPDTPLRTYPVKVTAGRVMIKVS